MIFVGERGEPMIGGCKIAPFPFFFFSSVFDYIHIYEMDEIKLRNEGGDIIFVEFLRNNYRNE